MPVIKKFFTRDILLTASGLGAAALAVACAFYLSSSVRRQLDSMEREASGSRVLSVLQALDQEVLHLTDYTTGYAMWDDSYAFVQQRGKSYLDTNYTPSVLAVSPVRLVGIYDLQRRLLFSTALDEAGNPMPVSAELGDPAFAKRFAEIKDSHGSLGIIDWLDHYGYLISICPITDSSGTRPVSGYLLFGRPIGGKMLNRIQALTGVSVQAMPEIESLPKAGSLMMRTPLLGDARVEMEMPDGHQRANAAAAFADTDRVGAAVEFRMELPANIFETGRRLSGLVRTFMLIVAGAFALFVLLAGIETRRRRRELRARVLESERLREARDEAGRLQRQAESADRAKSAFLAMMSHEIRTPLNAIIGYAELLRATPLDRESAQGLQSIRESGDVLMRVLNDVLDFSKIEAGELAIVSEPVSMRALVAEVCALFGAAAQARNDELSFAVDPGVPAWVGVDGARVRQVISNLLSNAVKFTESGRIEVRVRWEEGRLHFDIEDEGIGVAPEAVEELFKPFIQADSATSRRYDGSGLGLAICRRLCRLMGGDITFRRPVSSRGAAFSFDLPAPAVASPSEREVADEPPPWRLESMPSVLVVDDHAMNARLMVAILKRFGIAARVASSGAAAIESYCTERPDLILMDIQMPGMDGLEATTRIRQIETERNAPPTRIVAVTADILENCRADALRVGMDGYMSKPVQIAEIQHLLEELRTSLSHSAAL